MKKFVVELEVENEAFHGDTEVPDWEVRNVETARILEQIAKHLRYGAGNYYHFKRKLHDSNGNTVGTAEFKEEADE